jgi:5S rRNA maturation endonuclease (ribonuclease M5)
LAALRSFQQVDILTDPDKAGERAAGEIYGALARWTKVRRIELERGTDANTLTQDELAVILSLA